MYKAYANGANWGPLTPRLPEHRLARGMRASPVSSIRPRPGNAMNEPRWPTTLQQARDLQLQMRDQVVLHPPGGFAPRRVAGADVSFDRGGSHGYAAVVVLDAETLETVEEATAVAPLEFPYVPGFLSFRELPVLDAAWRQLSAKPDLVVFDGQGLAHPRRFGIACHGGVLWDVPAIGCAKSLLVGSHAELGEARGSTASLLHHGEQVGAALRTRAAVKPVYVSPGHRIDFDAVAEWVLRLAPRFREPETTRQAHRRVNDLRRAASAKHEAAGG